jgi:hypothetical protein
MRHLLVAAVLLGTAACAWEPVAPVAPGPPLAPAPVISLYFPLPNLVPSFLAAPGPGRLTLSNFSFDRAHLLAVATAAPDCYIHLPGEIETEFEVPLNGTRLIIAPPGANICWKRQLAEDEPPQLPASNWTDWNRAFVAQGTAVNSRM